MRKGMPVYVISAVLCTIIICVFIMYVLAVVEKKKELSYVGYNINFLIILYGGGSLKTIYFMIVCMFTTILMSIFIATGYSFKV